MGYTMEMRTGHVEVYDGHGAFCFSADTLSEARKELLTWYVLE